MKPRNWMTKNGHILEIQFKIRFQIPSERWKCFTPVNIDLNLARDWNNFWYFIRRKLTIIKISDYIYREMIKNPPYSYDC